MVKDDPIERILRRTPRLIAELSIDPSLNGYSLQRTKQFSKELLQCLNAAPGIASAAFNTTRLLEGNQWTSTMTVEGYDRGPDENMSQHNASISPGYFATMGIPLLMGRDFTDRDELADATLGERNRPPYRVAIANERFAQHYFGDRNPIGRRLGFGGDPNTPTPIESSASSVMRSRRSLPSCGRSSKSSIRRCRSTARTHSSGKSTNR